MLSLEKKGGESLREEKKKRRKKKGKTQTDENIGKGMRRGKKKHFFVN